MKKNIVFSRKIIWLCVLIVSILVSFIYASINNVFTTKIIMFNQMHEQVPSGEIIKDKLIEQEIRIPKNFVGKTIEIEVLFSTYNRKNKSVLEVSLQQGSTRETILINTEKLKDNAYKKILFSTNNFIEGNVNLQIKGLSGEVGNAVTAWLTKDLSLGAVSIDNVQKSEWGLVFKEIVPTQKYNLLFGFLFSIVLMLASLKIFNYKNSFININFLLSTCVIVILILLRFPSLTTSAEIWAESATNFFNNANSKGWLDNIKTLDAGYLPLFPRLLALFLVKFFHIKANFPIFAQAISIILIAVFASFITLNEFRSIIKPDFIRLLIAISLGAGLFHDYELYTFINFAYMGIIPCFMLLFYNFERRKRIIVITASILTFLILSSKAYFILFFPIYLFMFIYHLRYKNFKTLIYYLTSLISLTIQIIIVFINRATWTSQPTSNQVSDNISIFVMLRQTTLFYIKSIFGFAFKLSNNANIWTSYIVPVIIIVITLIVLFQIRKKINNKIYIFIISANLLAIASIFFSMTVPYIRQAPVIDKTFFVPNIRNFFFSNALLFISIISLFVSFFRERKNQIIAGVFCVLLYSLNGYNASDPYKYKNLSFSQWNELYTNFDTNGCLPVNPYPWIICKDNNRILFNSSKLASNQLINQIDIETLNPESKNWKVIGFLLDKGSIFNKRIKVIAYDSTGNEIANTIEKTEGYNKYGYFLFDKKQPISKITFFYEDNSTLFLKEPSIMIFGN
ncbi:hypothetical protein GC102_19440 [Paenibacillus sp. LMG 31460]|uniref:Glycosyltransferase RgtA/B/C/D-like domain-containing protein n=1 Tax=Paenibacillus germinis TaxID=2654979 RepID=A0ABX1Z6H1_9BACL|nr:hypothetical protein [Paenibacillus germinis]NOU87924.1 hypothetical protein [Paenibacillus germinis]